MSTAHPTGALGTEKHPGQSPSPVEGNQFTNGARTLELRGSIELDSATGDDLGLLIGSIGSCPQMSMKSTWAITASG